MLHYSIITPERTVAEGDADAITLPTQSGEITVLPGHAALSTLLAPGEMRVKQQKTETTLAVSTGFVKIAANAITILADTAERSEELELEAIEKAKAEADAALKNVRAGDDVSYAAAAAALEREIARYKVALKGKTRKHS